MQLPETTGYWKRREVDGGLIWSWLKLPDYVPHETDVKIKWGELYNYDNRYERHTEWQEQYGLADVFEVHEVFGEPRNDMDRGNRGIELLVARFAAKDMAMLFKLTYG